MKRMTSEIIYTLEKCVNQYGDLPFSICDNENGRNYFDVFVFANTFANGGCEDENDTPVIGIAF